MSSILRRIREWRKHKVELGFQRKWVKLYTNHMSKVLEYWRRYRFLTEIEGYVDFQSSRVLDVGCGISSLLNHIDAKEKWGVDPLMDEYKELFAYGKAFRFKKARGENLPFPANSFDIIVCSNALDHTEDPKKVVDEIHRVLRVGGNLILTVELFPETDKTQKRDLAHPHALSEHELISLLRNFDIVFHKQSHFIGLYNYVLYGENFETRKLEHVLVAREK